LLRTELERLNKVEYLGKKFAGKAGLMESWLKDKREYLSSADFGDTIQAVQAKLRAHQTFENQLKLHQPGMDELGRITKEIYSIINVQTAEHKKLEKIEASWKEIHVMSESRNRALLERQKDRQVFEETCQRFSKASEQLYLWLEKVADDLIEPVIVNSTSAVQLLLESMEKTRTEQRERIALFDEINELAERIQFGGLFDLHQISEYTLEVKVILVKTLIE
jgi:regulator of sigma D